MTCPLPLEIKQDEGVIVLAKRGSGKTFFIKFLINSLSPEYRFVILDVTGEYKEFAKEKNVEYHLVNPRKEGAEMEIDAILDKVRAQANCVVVLDEADRYEYGTIRKTKMSDLVNIGRHWGKDSPYGAGYISSARRTANIPKDFLVNYTHAFIFAHEYPNDIKVLEQWFGKEENYWKTIPEHTMAYFKDNKYLGLIRVNAPNAKSAKPAEEKLAPKENIEPASQS